MFFLITAIIFVALITLEINLGWTIKPFMIGGSTFSYTYDFGNQTGNGGPLSLFFMLASILPMLAVTVRRLHDVNKSGLNVLWLFVPIIGLFILLFYYLKRSQPGTNKYGPNPFGINPPEASTAPPTTPPENPAASPSSPSEPKPTA